MAGPITWRNVTINDGSNSASLGNAAAGFGQNAIQGLDIFSGQMQDRINREDTLLTNDAIASALSGGPAVSKNRRVDANALQLAVERDKEGIRAERGFEDDLLTSAVSRRLNTANADVREKDLATYDDRWALEQETAQSESDHRAAQARIAEAELKLKQKDTADQERIAAGRAKMNEWLYGGELNKEADAAIQAKFKDDPRFLSMPESQQREFLEQQRKNYRFSVFNDPEAAREIYQRFGLQPIEAEQFTAFGQDAAAARRAAQEVSAERAALAQEAEQATIKNIDKFVNGGDLTKLGHNGSEWTYEGGSTADAATVSTVLQDLGLDPKDDKDFANAVQSKFRTATAFEAAARQLVGKYPDGLPDASTVRSEVNAMHEAVKEQAKKRATVQAEAQYSSDWLAAGNTYLDAMSSSSADPKKVSPEVAGAATKGDPRLAREAIRALNDKPQNREELKDSGDKLKLAVSGLKEAGSDIRLPEDASNSLKSLYAAYRAAVKVADGGAYVPPVVNVGKTGGPGFIRPVTPGFSLKQEHAVKAADLLIQLQRQMEAEAKTKKERQLRRELDNY